MNQVCFYASSQERSFFMPLSNPTLKVFLCCISLVLVGCVLLPIPLPENKVLAGKPVTEEQLSFLSSKDTTTQEVLDRLGKPNIIWEDARIFVYNWEMRWGILFWAVGAYYSGAMGMAEIPKHYLLLIQFNDQNRITRFERAVRPLTQSCSDFLQAWEKNVPMTPASPRNNPEVEK